jgi:hypothetical protein
MCAHTLRDGIVQIAYKMLWEKMEKIIERLGRLIEL